MTLKEIKLTNQNHFVAMEYYYLVLNRTYLVLLTKDYLIGIQGNGLVSIEGGEDMITQQITAKMAIKGNLSNPYSYLKNRYLEKAQDVDLLDGSIVNTNNVNFMIKRNAIINTQYNPKKKYGMGYYPHDGRVTIETLDNRKREFIILGNQSGQDIAHLILTNKS